MSQQTLDTLIATLVGMGFEICDCQEAVSAGKLSATSAVEWILAGKPEVTSAVGGHQSVLSLRKNKKPETASGSSSCFNAPLPIDDLPQDPSGQENAQSSSEFPVAMEENIPEIHSRYAETREDREKFLEKKRLKFASEIRSDKAMEKEAKSLILQEIQADREARRSKSVKKMSGEEHVVKTEQTIAEVPKTTVKKDCMIQFRLPGGRTLRKAFPNETTLQALASYVRSQETSLISKRFIFVQPFPRKEFDPNSVGDDSLEVLNLTPSASLVVQPVSESVLKVEKSEAESISENLSNETGERNSIPPSMGNVPSGLARMELPCEVPGNNQTRNLPEEIRNSIGSGSPRDFSHALSQPPPHQEYSFEPPSVPAPQQNWPVGPGRRLEDEDRLPLAIAAVHSADEEEFQGGQAQVRFGSGENPMQSFHSHISTPSQQHRHDWGSGHALGEISEQNIEESSSHDEENDQPDPMIVEQIQEDPEDRFHPNMGLGARLGTSNPSGLIGEESSSPADRRSQIVHAYEARHQQRNRESEQCSHELHTKSSSKSSGTLKNISMQAVISRIGARGRNSLSTLGSLPTPLAQSFLHHLIKYKMLNSNTVHLFRSCLIKNVTLDYYIYATNQLLKSMRMLTGLVSLSLRGCGLLTDTAMHSVSQMTNLQALTLTSCSQLSDHGLLQLIGLSKLGVLILDETRVTDQGLIQYLQRRSSPDNLMHLSLRNVTGITNTSLEYLNRTSIAVLDMSFTKITRIDLIVNNTQQLEELHISGCSIPLEQFKHLLQLKCCLRALYIDGVETGQMEEGNNVLCYLKGMKKLHTLVMQFRASVTHAGIEAISSCPLTHLNLSNYTLINDLAMSPLSQMKNLVYLNLSNTRITDTGLNALVPILCNLSELTLNHTAITSSGLISLFEGISCTRSLTTLSLAYSHVGNKFLMSKLLNTKCPNLLELNFSGTVVSDTGIQNLHLPCLTRLLLDGTRVRVYVDVSLFTGCTALSYIRAENRRLWVVSDSDPES